MSNARGSARTALAAAVGLLPVATFAQPPKADAQSRADNARSSTDYVTPDPYDRKDETWITLSGTVADVGRDQFTLDYGSNTISVHMKDQARDAGAYELERGDGVIVTGLIDDHFFKARTIDANSLYVNKLETFFYANPLGDQQQSITYIPPNYDGTVILRGAVTSIGDEQFTMDTGLRKVTVDVDELDNDPLDEQGYQQIDVGDRVAVTGHIDFDFFGTRELVADDVSTIVNVHD